MLKLFAEDTNLNNPVAGFRWCVDKDTVDKLKELGITNPFLLLIIAKKQDGYFEEVDLKVAPLDQMMEFIEFHAPGLHRVFAMVVWTDEGRPKDHKKIIEVLHRKFRYHNGVNLVNFDGQLAPEVSLTRYTNSQINYASVDVVVPEGHFAEEPSAWEKWWVNLWFESKPANRCQFRKRRFLAYTIQPLVILGFAVAKGILTSGQILLLLLSGIRGIRYRAIFHPFRYSLMEWECGPSEKSSVFLEDARGEERHPAFFFLMPTVQIIILALASLIRSAFQVVFSIGGPIVIWFLVVNLLIAIVIVLATTGGLRSLFPEETVEQARVRREATVSKKYQEYSDLMCANGPGDVSVSALPPSRQTLYLKFQDFKRRVCLPYARR